MNYNEQLRHPKWKSKRLEIIERDENKCRDCGSKKLPLVVHHKIYIKGRMAWEYDKSLITLCEDCHESWHHILDVIKEELCIINKCDDLYAVRRAIRIAISEILLVPVLHNGKWRTPEETLFIENNDIKND